MIPLTTLATFLSTEGIEGIRLQAYDDATGKTLKEGDEAIGVPTIAMGVTVYRDGTPVEAGDELTIGEAWDETFGYLKEDLVPSFERLISVSLPEHKQAAFGSWLYNFGETKARRYSLPKMINAGEPDRVIIKKWMEYIYAGGQRQLGLYRRRMAEVLLWLDLDWKAALNVAWEDDVFDVIEKMGGSVDVELDLFDDDYDPTPETPLTVEDLNNRSLMRLKSDKIRITKLTPRVPIDAVDYLENDGPPKVKRIEDSQRGKGYAKTTTGKEVGVAGVVGTGAVAVGAVEPVVAFVDRYPKETIAWVFALMMVFGVVYYFYGQWQRQKGEDDAVDLLG